MLNHRVSTAEETATVISRRNNQLAQRYATRMKLAMDMFRDMRSSDCPLEQALLGLVSLHAMFGDVSFLLLNVEHLACEFLSDVLGTYDAKRSEILDCSVHDATVQAAQDREAT